MSKRLMIRSLIFLFCILLTVILPGSDNQDQWRFFQMENGLKVFLRLKPGIPMVNMVMGIDLGSKDEAFETGGRVHLLEHLLLSSPTRTFNRDDLPRELRMRGCYLNAHTDHDLMTVEISASKDETGTVLAILKEKLFYLKPAQGDLDREKEIILEEIKQIHDTPFRVGTDAALSLIFENHPYANPIYGNSQIIQDTGLEQIHELYHLRFFPSNCSLAVVGDFSLDEMENSIRRVFETLPKSPAVRLPIPQTDPVKRKKEKRLRMDTKQAYLVIAYSAPEFGHKDQFVFDVYNHILGKGNHPLLGLAVRGRKKMTAGFSTRYLYLKYGGVFLIYFTADAKKIFLLQREVQKFLDKTNTFRYAKEDFLKKEQVYVTDYLESAKNQIKLDSEQNKQLGLNSAISTARFMLLRTGRDSYHYREAIDQVKSADLRRVASEYICGKKPAVIFVLPEKK